MTSSSTRLPGQLAGGGERGAAARPLRAAAQTLGCKLISNSSERGSPLGPGVN